MPYCAISNCKNRSHAINMERGGISYHHFPKDPYIKEKWINATGRKNWFPTKYSTICSSHFIDDDFNHEKKRRWLYRTAYPKIAVWVNTDIKTKANSSSRSHSLESAENQTEDSSSKNLPVITSVTSLSTKVSGTAHDNSAQLDSEAGELSGDGNETSQEKEEIPEGKVLITRVYRYLLKEYETLKSTISMLDLQPLADILRRTSDATGVSQCTVLTVMEESKRPAGPYSDGDRKRKKVHMCDSLTTEDSCKESAPDIQNDVTSNPIVSAIPVMTVDIAPTTMQPPENIPEVKSEVTVAIDQTTLPPHVSTENIPEEQTQYKYPMHNLKAEPDDDSMHDQVSMEQDPLQDNTSNMTEVEATICEVKTEPQDPPSSSQACASAVSVPIKMEVMDQDNQPSTRSPAKFDGVQGP